MDPHSLSIYTISMPFFFSFSLWLIHLRHPCSVRESSDRYPCSVGEHFFIAWFAFNVGSIDSFTHLLKSAISSDKCNKSLTLSSEKMAQVIHRAKWHFLLGGMTFSNQPNGCWFVVIIVKQMIFIGLFVRDWCLAYASPVLSSLTDSWQLLFESSKRVRCWSLQFKMALILYVVLFQWSLHSWCGWWNDESFMLLELFALIALAIAIIMSISSFLFFWILFCLVCYKHAPCSIVCWIECSSHTHPHTPNTLYLVSVLHTLFYWL